MSVINKIRTFAGWEIKAESSTDGILLDSQGKPVNQDFNGCMGEGTMVEAADDEEGGDKFYLAANTGVPMQVRGFFDPVLIDFRGARFAQAKTPVIMDHNTSLRIGHTTAQAIVKNGEAGKVGGRPVKGPMIGAMGLRSSNSKTATEFIADARNGFPFQVSVGARILDGEYIPEDKEVTVNGKTFKGPLIHVKKSLIRELSVTVLGADGKTSAKITAQGTTQENLVMTFEEFVASLKLDITALSDEQKTALKAQWKASQTPAPATPPVQASETQVPVEVTASAPSFNQDDYLQQRRQLDAAEDTRQGAIRASIVRYADVLATQKINYRGTEQTFEAAHAAAISNGDDPRDFEIACLQASRNQQNGSGHGPAIHSINRDEWDNEVLSCAVLRANGMTPMSRLNKESGEKFGIEHMFTPEQLEASHRPQYQGITRISELFDLQIRAAGGYYSGTNRHGTDFQAATVKAWNQVQASGFSTLNITNVLENIMHKATLAAYSAAEGVWRQVCGRRNLNDFRPHNFYRMVPDGTYRQVDPTGELKHIGMTDEKYSIQADTYGCMITIDRKTRKNDDLGVVMDQARGMGTLASQRIEESVFVLLLSNPGSFFHANNNNLLSGATSALGLLNDGEGLDAARLLFRNQVVNGKPVGTSPRILLTGTGLETTANRMWNQERTEAAADSTGERIFVDNPHAGLYRPVISPYLNNTDITTEDGSAVTGQSATQWYLLADPASPLGSTIAIGFMDGIDTPHFDEAETQFNIPDGIQLRSYLDWGVAMWVQELGVKSAGA